VVDFLAAHGVKQSLMSAQAYGESNPVAPNDTPEGKAKNRRVVISLSGNGS
jgi:chemotaxis protein MotB